MSEKQRLAAAVRDARVRKKGHITVPVEMLAVALGVDQPASEPTTEQPPATASDNPSSAGAPAGVAKRARRTAKTTPSDPASK